MSPTIPTGAGTGQPDKKTAAKSKLPEGQLSPVPTAAGVTVGLAHSMPGVA